MTATVKVKVRDGWLVYDGQQQRSAGETVDTDPDTAEQWVAAGWAETVDKSAAGTRRR
jgi:hypothetical protein